MNGKELGAKIKLHREASNKSLQEIADLIGTSKSHVWEMENGKCVNPSLWMVKSMANAFGYTVSGFIGESPNIVNNSGKIRELADRIVKLTY